MDEELKKISEMFPIGCHCLYTFNDKEKGVISEFGKEMSCIISSDPYRIKLDDETDRIAKNIGATFEMIKIKLMTNFGSGKNMPLDMCISFNGVISTDIKKDIRYERDSKIKDIIS